MGELIDFCKALKDRQLAKVISDLNEKIKLTDIPNPEEFGWIPDTEVDGLVTSYRLENSGTTIGYVDGGCDYTYLEVNSDRFIYKMSLPELALGIETGTL